MTAIFAAFRSAFQDSVRPGRLAGIAATLGFLGASSAIWRYVGLAAGVEPQALYGQFAEVVLYRVVALVSAVAAVGVVSQEVEQNTLIYLLGRTLRRGHLYAARALACWASAAATLAAGALITAAMIVPAPLWFESGVVRDLAIILAGSAAYTFAFAALGIHLKRALLISLIIAFAWEGLVPGLPSMRVVSLGAYLRDLAAHRLGDDPGILSIFALQTAEPLPAWVAWLVVLGAAAASLGLGSWLFSRLQHSPKDESD
jgi:ABC-type transport system involved in multi-copper enzyme maturation permease subunit